MSRSRFAIRSSHALEIDLETCKLETAARREKWAEARDARSNEVRGHRLDHFYRRRRDRFRP